mmetsp:Transcript_20850/g.34939  ORF Transcript_20850/g.34939 Transcript_20850/m.34939 type:complete len:274 (-) Transcript_20850:420-1241(-)
MEQYLSSWLSNQWLCWGAGSILAANIGFFSTVVVLEVAIANVPQSSLISYGQDPTLTRKDFVSKTQTRVPFKTQLMGCIWHMLGPTAILSAVINTWICNYLFPYAAGDPLYPSLGIFLLHMVLLLLIGDLGLYWGHRIQHMVPYLWENFHSLHHTIDTPTPASTIYIHGVDATLQAALPIVIATTIVRPHPITYYAYVMLRLSDNAANHSGLKAGHCWWADLFTLKFLPFRAPPAHHDLHHKYSNHAGNTKNFGEFFWLWDSVFGTLGNTKND